MSDDAIAKLAKRVIDAASVSNNGMELDAEIGDYCYHIERGGWGSNWYIQVMGPNGCYDYDGYWRDSDRRSLEDAVKQAIEGACVLMPREP